MFSGVTRALIADMKLDRPISIAMACPKPPTLSDIPEFTEKRTDEERRALVAVFALATMFVSHCLCAGIPLNTAEY